MRKRIICFLSLIFLSLSAYSIFDEDKSKCVVIEKNEKVDVTFGENAKRLIGYNPNEIIEKAKKRRIDFTKGEKVVEYLNTWDWFEEENQPTRLPNGGRMWILYHKFDLNGK